MAGPGTIQKVSEGLNRMEMTWTARRVGNALECDYRGINQTGSMILVFDRQYSMASRMMEPAWAYVRVRGKRAELSRTLAPLPPGLHHENPELPYGREVPARMSFEGGFQVELPLRDRDPYADFKRRPPAHPVEVTELVFNLGWAPMPATLPAAIAPVSWRDERLWLLPYDLIRTIQQVAGGSLEIAPVPGEFVLK